jgi:glycosyltransferase involved in cell wall biosynthesis
MQTNNPHGPGCFEPRQFRRESAVMATPPRVSIGLPVYNGERFLKDALDSILSQTYRDFELIISDNASSDHTEEICRRYAARDERVRYYRYDNNVGAARNFNRVFQLSRGEYFKWAAHDDICSPGFLQRCVKILDSDTAVVVCFSILLLTSMGVRRSLA